MPGHKTSRRDPVGEVRRLDIGYSTPEWRYFVGDLSPVVVWGLGLALYGAWGWFVVWRNPLDWIPGEQMVAAIGGVALTYLVASALNRVLSNAAGGYGLAPGGSRRLRGEFARGRFRILRDGRWGVFDASAPHAFSMREHRLRIDEARAEERARAFGAGQRPDHYRRAWQIVLDYWSHRFVLAAVSDEETAQRIVRRLHALDAFARGVDGAGTRTADGTAEHAAPLGKRPQLD